MKRASRIDGFAASAREDSDLQASHWLFFHSLVQERLRGLENRNHILTEGRDN